MRRVRKIYRSGYVKVPPLLLKYPLCSTVLYRTYTPVMVLGKYVRGIGFGVSANFSFFASFRSTVPSRISCHSNLDVDVTSHRPGSAVISSLTASTEKFTAGYEDVSKNSSKQLRQ